MQIYKKTVIEFLRENQRLKIPFFQRDYVWDENDVRDLLNDIDLHEDEYFLGSIITKNDHAYQSIIDGQQRITSFYLILKALALFEDKLLPDNLLEIKHIINNSDFHHYNIKHKESMHSIFNQTQYDFDTSRKDLTSVYDKNFSAIVNYFNSKPNCDDFFKKLNKKIIFSWVSFNNNVDENLIFSQINSTGKPLSGYDLVRNDLLASLVKEHGVTGDEEDKCVDSYLTKLEEINGYLSVDKQEPQNLLRLFFASLTKNLINSRTKEIYKEYKHIQTKMSSIEFFNQYYEFGLLYKYFFDGQYIKDDLEPNLLILKNQFNTYMILLIDILKQYCVIENKQIKLQDKANFKLCLEIVEYYLLKMEFAHKPSKILTRYIPTLVWDLHHLEKVQSLSYPMRLYLLLHTYPNVYNIANQEYRNLSYAPDSDDNFEENFFEAPIYKYNTKLVKSLLIRFYYYNWKTKINFNNFTIEHVLPQNLNEWRADGFSDPNEDDLANITHQIGNLTLTPYNSEYSNSIFPVKQKEMKSNESFAMNNYFFDLQAWNSETIRNRSHDLYHNYVTKMWNFSNLEKQIHSQLTTDQILNLKTPLYYDLVPLNDNISWFRNCNITMDQIKDLLYNYLVLNKNKKESEQTVLSLDKDGQIVWCLSRYFGLDSKKNCKEKVDNTTWDQWLQDHDPSLEYLANYLASKMATN